MVGNMDVGINTQNLMAILLVIALSVINIFGVKTGALIQNVFTFAKVAGLLGLVIVGIFIGRNAAALAANFGANFWAGMKALHPIEVGAGGQMVPRQRAPAQGAQRAARRPIDGRRTRRADAGLTPGAKTEAYLRVLQHIVT